MPDEVELGGEVGFIRPPKVVFGINSKVKNLASSRLRVALRMRRRKAFLTQLSHHSIVWLSKSNMRVLSLVVTALSVASTFGFAAIKTGDKIPAASLDFGFPPQKVFLPEYTSGKKMLIIGLPGAFTPT